MVHMKVISRSRIYYCVSFVVMLVMLMLNYGSYGLFLGKYSKSMSFMVPFFIALVIFFRDVLRKKHINKKLFITALVIITNLLISSLANQNMELDDINFVIAILTAYFLVESIDPNKILDLYVDVMLFLAVYSLVASFVILPLCVNSGIQIFQIYFNADRPYYDLGFAMRSSWLGIIRNNGFCREPGVFQVFLLIAIFVCLEKKHADYRNMIRIILFMITLLSTFSAVSYVIILCVVVRILQVYARNQKKAVKMYFSFLVLAAVVICIVSSNPTIKNELMRTAMKWTANQNSAEYVSLKVRTDGLIENAKLFFEHPIFGYGLVNSWREVIIRSGDVNVTGTTLIAFSALGIVSGTIMNLLIVLALKAKSKLVWMMWVCLFLLSLNSQNLIISFVIWTFLFLPLKNVKRNC